MAGFLTERRDELRSPFRSWLSKDYFMPGVEVHATQMLNLIRGDSLRRPPPGLELLCVLMAGALVGAGLPWLRPLPATVAALGGIAAVTAIAGLLFVQSNVWFPWLIVAGIQIPCALGASVLHQSLEWYRTRRRFEAEKRVAEARIREQAALIDKAQDAILVLSADGRVSYSNPSATRLYGWSADELQAGGAPSLLDSPAAAEARRTTLGRGEWSGELSQTTRAGRTIIVESRWTLLRSQAGGPDDLLLINSDVTEKRQLLAESLRMQRMEAIGALAGGMAHDLNNALAPILMGTQLLRRDSRDENTQRILGLMEASTRRGADMVRQVLLFARGRDRAVRRPAKTRGSQTLGASGGCPESARAHDQKLSTDRGRTCRPGF